MELTHDELYMINDSLACTYIQLQKELRNLNDWDAGIARRKDKIIAIKFCEGELTRCKNLLDKIAHMMNNAPHSNL